MMTVNKILFPVDFSERCRHAASHVRALAMKFESKVILLNVFESPTTNPGDLDFGALAAASYSESRGESAQKALDSFLQAEFSSLQVERRVEFGDPARTIVRVADDEKVDLIMMPTHGYGGFRRFILGSVTAKVLHDAECAVWTGAHLETSLAAQCDIKSVVCALDLTETSSSPLAAAVELTKQFGAKLTVSHAVPGSDAIPDKMLDSEFRQQLIADARARIESMIGSDGTSVGMCVEAGDVHRVVNGCAKAHQADLVIIGRPRHNGFGRLRTHSYAIIRESPCPVLSL